MPKYIFILGREPELSVAEVAAVAQKDKLKLVWELITNEYAVVQGELDNEFFARLAGTIKVAKVIGSCQAEPSAIKERLVEEVSTGGSGRVEFGMSWYTSTSSGQAGRPPHWLMATGLGVKKELKGRGHVRYVVSREANLSAVVVTKNKLLPPSGYDFVFVPKGEELIVARTVWVQEFEAWSKRDYGRPQRNARVGMLPPKLARLMLNLAGVSSASRLLDPFCGSGTVLQEAALLGCADMTGSDSDARGVDRTRQNFSWLKQQYPNITTEPKLLTADIKNLTTQLKNQTYDTIVTEPYLGPPLTGKENTNHLQQIKNELTEFYTVTLKVLGRSLMVEGRIVMVWPVLRVGKREYPLNLGTAMSAANLKLISPLPSEVPSGWQTPRSTLRYERPDQRVVREIAVLEKVQ